jgi:glycerol uptake facilitator
MYVPRTSFGIVESGTEVPRMEENSFAQKLGAEAVGTAVLVFLGAGSVPALYLARGGKGGAPFTGAELFAISTAFGLAVVAMVYAVGKISGCHINPAVTIAMAVTRRMPWSQAGPYVVAQCVGGVLGGLAIWGVFAHKVHDAGVGHVTYAANTSIGSAMLNEGLGTAILLFTVLGIVDKRGGADMLAGLVIGLIVIGIIITVGPQTGAAINPGRYTGTLITSQLAGLSTDWGQAWVYWVADVAGGITGVLAYDLLAKPRAAVAAVRSGAPAKGVAETPA